MPYDNSAVSKTLLHHLGTAVTPEELSAASRKIGPSVFNHACDLCEGFKETDDSTALAYLTVANALGCSLGILTARMAHVLAGRLTFPASDSLKLQIAEDLCEVHNKVILRSARSTLFDPTFNPFAEKETSS